jgi:Amt family ammonium transporter
MIRIELTESAIMGNPTHISDVLTDIRKLGVKVALDDFGTGYSSLNYLHQFPIDIIKIDRSFIAQLREGNELYKILTMISQLARSLGHEIVAEGIEDVKHQKMLIDMNFDFVQGFYYSKPLPIKQAGPLHIGNPPWKSD